ncbi:MAG: energy transducer TonB [Novosphingobium sp.]
MSASIITMAAVSGFAAKPDGVPASERPRSAYRFGGRPMRVVAVGATLVVHLAVGAVVALGWPRTEKAQGATHLTSVIILPRPADEPRRRPDPGNHAEQARSEPLPTSSSPPPAILLSLPSPVAAQSRTEVPVPADGGREDVLAVATQAFRRAVMERLEAQRRPLPSHAVGGLERTGIVLFRIDRTGRLLDVSVEESTGRPALDRAAVAIVRRAAPFPVIPDALPDELSITLPVEFLVADGRKASIGQALAR